jgi:putative Holliday junction resolvase
VARVLALDPGSRRVGVAVSDSAGALAFPRDALAAGEDLPAQVADLVEAEGATLVVVGRPVSLEGRQTDSTRAADELAALLREALSVDVVAHDERLTTVSASRGLAEAGHRAKSARTRVDSAAAVVLLQSYLDAHRG